MATKPDPEQLAQDLSLFMNRLGGNSEDYNKLIACILNDHRTIQQNLFRFILKLIDAWAEADKLGRFDPRNEGTVKTCTKIKNFLENEDVRLPYI